MDVPIFKRTTDYKLRQLESQTDIEGEGLFSRSPSDARVPRGPTVSFRAADRHAHHLHHFRKQFLSGLFKSLERVLGRAYWYLLKTLEEAVICLRKHVSFGGPNVR